MRVAMQSDLDLLEATEGAFPILAAEIGQQRRRCPFEARPARRRRRLGLDGDTIEPRHDIGQCGIAELETDLLLFQERAADRPQPIDRPARRWIERDMQRHGQRRPFGQDAGGVVEQELVRGWMATHFSSSSFSNASRRRPRASLMRDFTVPNGSRNSSAMAVWVLSSKKALRMTVSWSADRPSMSSFTLVYVCPAATDLSAEPSSWAKIVSQSPTSMAGRPVRRRRSIRLLRAIA